MDLELDQVVHLQVGGGQGLLLEKTDELPHPLVIGLVAYLAQGLQDRVEDLLGPGLAHHDLDHRFNSLFIPQSAQGLA